MITIKEVALKAGVSAGTVSKVIKGYPTISAKTREKVKAIIKETGYVPNAIASALSSKKLKRIALYTYINDLSQQIDEIDMSYLIGAFEAKEDDCTLITIYEEAIHEMNKDNLIAYFDSLAIQAVVVFGLNKDDHKMHDLIASKRYKMVVIDAPYVDDEISYISIDQAKAQYEVAKKIVRKNERVIYLAGKRNAYVTDERIKGMEKLAKEKNLDLQIRYAEFAEDKAQEIIQRESLAFNKIVAASDLMAIGAKRVAPKTKVCGFDGIKLLAYVAPDMLTVIQDFKMMGYQAVKEAINLLNGSSGRGILLPYTIAEVKKI